MNVSLIRTSMHEIIPEQNDIDDRGMCCALYVMLLFVSMWQVPMLCSKRLWLAPSYT